MSGPDGSSTKRYTRCAAGLPVLRFHFEFLISAHSSEFGVWFFIAKIPMKHHITEGASVAAVQVSTKQNAAPRDPMRKGDHRRAAFDTEMDKATPGRKMPGIVCRRKTSDVARP